MRAVSAVKVRSSACACMHMRGRRTRIRGLPSPPPSVLGSMRPLAPHKWVSGGYENEHGMFKPCWITALPGAAIHLCGRGRKRMRARTVGARQCALRQYSTRAGGIPRGRRPTRQDEVACDCAAMMGRLARAPLQMAGTGRCLGRGPVPAPKVRGDGILQEGACSGRMGTEGGKAALGAGGALRHGVGF